MKTRTITISLIKGTNHLVVWSKENKELIKDYNLNEDSDFLLELNKKYKFIEFEEVEDLSEIMKQIKSVLILS